jgi:hypothetical protein
MSNDAQAIRWAGGIPVVARSRVEFVGPIASSFILLREAAQALRTSSYRMFGSAPSRRQRESVATEYDRGVWKRILEERRWESCSSLHDYVVPQNEAIRLAMIDGRIVRIPTRDYYEFRLKKLQELVAAHVGDAESLVELGSGWGVNLFSLALAGKWKKLVGYDVSINGVRATTEAAAHFGVTSVRAKQLDLTCRTDPVFAEIRGATAFSYLCLEQLKYSTKTVIENLLAAGVVRVVHIEPVPELLSRWRFGDVASRFYLSAHDYQNNLLSTLRSFERQRKLRILSLSRASFSPRPVNDPALICWERV